MRKAFPLIALAALLGLLAVGLKHDPQRIPSPLIGKSAPMFKLPELGAADSRVSPQALRGQVWLLNVWASWCSACRTEHSTLLEVAHTPGVVLVGLDYKDSPDAARNTLDALGDPYDVTLDDRDGRVGIDYGVYGVPETFVIDKRGIVRQKFIGGLDSGTLGELLPLLDRLRHE